MNKLLALPLSLCLLTACSAPATMDQTPAAGNSEQATATPSDVPNATNTPKEIATGLNTPWAINKVGDEFYISERPGTVAYINATGELTRQKVEFSDQLASVPESGFLGFVLKDDFAKTKQAYGYYVYEENGQPLNKIAVFELQNNTWREVAVLLEGIETGSVHHGGRLELDADGVLFATIGDASNPELAQDPNSVNGKILRLNSSNKFEIYSMGHRNPQGIEWADGKMYASEHGQSANDEINIIENGKNYGWPLIEGNEKRDGLASPFVTTGSNETWAPSGIDSKDGLLYVAALRGTAIKVINLKSGKVDDSIEGYGRIRDVLVDGEDVYAITNNTDGRGQPDKDDDKLILLATP
ncbi:PQQ-dependent sugar dehydrogenase [Planococcus sp. N028]|uniref:PQQ-dependent sugar dehydrogenase n=1 Tax=Planococcus shixiaomingii TaxID=3058393 RepID=A0ABT8N045_9BACL|nr:PQQ-dependent sugar dehydrogenase [Planococcus sp. N028]MDN7241057.1 PQQ-dependent sugar dehydrogenase [Planococcus sp. N028]